MAVFQTTRSVPAATFAALTEAVFGGKRLQRSRFWLGPGMCPSRPGVLITAQQHLGSAVLAGAEAKGRCFAIIKARKRDENTPEAKQEPRAQPLRPQQPLRSRQPFFPKKMEVRKAVRVESGRFYFSLFTSKWQALRALWKISLTIHHSSFIRSGKCTLCKPAT